MSDNTWPTQARYQVMLNAAEEGGLFELPDEMVNVLPDSTRSERAQLSKFIVAELYNAGLIELWSAAWPREDIRRVQSADAHACLEANTTWELLSKKQSAYVFISLTASGQETWLSTKWSE